MSFVEYEGVEYATRALHDLYGHTLGGLVKGGIRLSYSKNPLVSFLTALPLRPKLIRFAGRPIWKRLDSDWQPYASVANVKQLRVFPERPRLVSVEWQHSDAQCERQQTPRSRRAAEQLSAALSVYDASVGRFATSRFPLSLELLFSFQ
jgi:hypothetical protein